MNLLLDMKTIFIALVLGHLFTLVLISAYWRDHTKDVTVSTFFFAKCAQAAAWSLLSFRDRLPDLLSISLANSLLFIGAALEIVAVLYLRNSLNRRFKRFYIALTSFNIIGFHLIMLFDNQESYRIAFASIGTAAIVVIPAYQMVAEKASSVLMKVMGSLYLLVVVTLFGRAIAALLSQNAMGLFTPGIYQTLSFIALYLVMILGNTGFILILKERADQELVRLANHDELTGILNRRTFVSRAGQHIAGNVKSGKPISLLLFDVDRFKTINDSYGHDTGDLVLQDLTKQIQHHLSADDLFARYGGDEFAILLPGKDELESTRHAEQIRQSVAGSVIPGLQAAYTISLGVLTVIPEQDTHLEALYKVCDKALYGAKNNGRNNVFRCRMDEEENSA